MRRRDIERRLGGLGWELSRHGGAHDMWTDGIRRLAIPRHREIANGLARKLLKKAAAGGGRKDEV